MEGRQRGGEGKPGASPRPCAPPSLRELEHITAPPPRFGGEEGEEGEGAEKIGSCAVWCREHCARLGLDMSVHGWVIMERFEDMIQSRSGLFIVLPLLVRPLTFA